MKENAFERSGRDQISLDRHRAQAETAGRAALGGAAMTLQAAKDLAHASKLRGAGTDHSAGITRSTVGLARPRSAPEQGKHSQDAAVVVLALG